MENWMFRRDLIDARTLRALSRRSDAKGAVRLFSQYAAMAATGTGIFFLWGTWWCVPVFLAHGVLLFAYGYAGQHELVHRTAFQTRQLNDLAAHVASFIRLFPTEYQRSWHFAHHRNTKDPDKDSEILGDGKLTLGRYLWFLAGIDYWTYRIGVLLRVARGRKIEPFLTDEEWPGLVREARLYLAGYALVAAASIAFQSWAVLIYWLGPLTVATPFYRAYIATEHYARPQVPDVILNTRTTHAGPVMQWLMWNMPYHTEHHLFPGVPFHKLAELSRTLRAGEKSPMAPNRIARSHLAVNWEIFRGLLRRDPAYMVR